MNIVCRKCNYIISEQEINQHYNGVLLNFAKELITLGNNLFTCFRKQTIEEDPKIKYENTLLGRANHYKIRCPQCFQYNGWIKITDESEKIE